MGKRPAAIVGLILALAIVLATPVHGATFKAHGKYVGTVVYDGEKVFPDNSVTSINLGGATCGFDVLGMSTLYLTFDFYEEDMLKEGLENDSLPEKSLSQERSERGTFKAHLPLVLFNDPERNSVSVVSAPYDDYLFVFKGKPFTLSLTSAIDGEYAFSSLKDPLGLVREIDTEDLAILKLTGKHRGLDILGYLVSAVFADKDGDTQESGYGAVRATYKSPFGLRLGLTCGVHLRPLNFCNAKKEALNAETCCCADLSPALNTDIDGNVSIDLEIPIPLSKKATLQGAYAVNMGRRDGSRYTPKKAVSIAVRKLECENITFAGDLIGVEPGFTAVAPKKDSSSALDYEGKRYLRGEGKATLQLFGRNVKLALANERTTDYDGSFDSEKGSSKNKVSGEIEYELPHGLTVTADAYLDKVLATEGQYLGDYTMRARTKVAYAPLKGNEIWARLWQVLKEHKEDCGKAYKLECGVELEPVEHIKLKATGGYEQGTLTFPGYTSVGKHTSKVYGEMYGELEHTLKPIDADRADIFLAGLAKFAHRDGEAPEITLVSYGEMTIIFNERLTGSTAFLLAEEPKKTSHYAPTLYNKLDYRISDNSSLAVGCTFKDANGTLDAQYRVGIGDATLEIAYGKTGLRDECEDSGHTGKPWAWLCSAEIDPKPKRFALTITIPF
ncbi:MAG: hypothetical protein WBJ72_02325 [Bacillota bacterium]